MRLWLVAEETFAVYAVEHSDGEHDCCLFLSEEWSPPNTASATERKRLLRHIAQACKDPRSLSGTCHAIAEGIWQFKVHGGSYRIPWFYDENKLIICTHFFVKKGQKTPKAERDRAIRIRQEYFSKKASKALDWKR